MLRQKKVKQNQSRKLLIKLNKGSKKKMTKHLSKKKKKIIKKGGMNQENIDLLKGLRDSLGLTDNPYLSDEAIAHNYDLYQRNSTINPIDEIISEIYAIDLSQKSESEFGGILTKEAITNYLKKYNNNYDLIYNFLKTKKWMKDNLDPSIHLNDEMLFNLIDNNQNNFRTVIGILQEFNTLPNSPQPEDSIPPPPPPPPPPQPLPLPRTVVEQSNPGCSSSSSQCQRGEPLNNLWKTWNGSEPNAPKERRCKPKLINLFDERSTFVPVRGDGLCGVRSIMCSLGLTEDVNLSIANTIFQFLQTNPNAPFVRIPYERSDETTGYRQIERGADLNSIIRVINEIISNPNIALLDLSFLMRIYTYVHNCDGIILSYANDGAQSEFYRSQQEQYTSFPGIGIPESDSGYQFTTHRTIVLVNIGHATLIIPHSGWSATMSQISLSWDY